MKHFLKTGDVVLADLGYVAKIRPCVVLASNPDSQRDTSIIAPLTGEVRGGETEVQFQKPPWLTKPCVLNLSGLLGVENNRIQRRLGPFPAAALHQARIVLAKMLGLEEPPTQSAA
jgi:mRNA interferase MazF